ncbi:MAG: Gfo/Idh/MocA family oxidoreductase [Planctomycetes bacterium]|nr:Gfo/Idh/MocA family oxidoreductase [Planctomycetota bacterium]
MRSRVNRRAFLRNTALGGAGLLILKDSRLAFGYKANEKLNVALVGVAGRGSWFVGAIPRLGENVVAMCDVNERKAEGAFKAIPKARKFNDFRRMLDEMDKEIDAVVVATPDNTHAVASARAMKMGKGVLCEKPLTHDVYEARSLRATAAKYKVATQMGNQGTASRGFREAAEIIQAGVLGEVREVHAWNTGGGAGERPRPTDVHPVPDYLHWDLWLGPAQYRPYNSRWLGWHTWRDFATGNLGNWASHTMNVIFKGLRLDSLWPAKAWHRHPADDLEDTGRMPVPQKQLFSLQAEVSGYHKDTFPKWEIVRYDFPARREMPPVRINWYNGGGRAPGPRGKIEEMMGRRLDWGDAGEKRWQDHAGCLLVGTKGMLHSTGHNTSYTLLPKDKFEGFEVPESSLPRSRGHEREWVDACKGGPAAMSNFDYAGPLAEFVLLGNVATQFEGKIEFDPAAMKIVNIAKANEALRREYRKGWSL